MNSKIYHDEKRRLSGFTNPTIIKQCIVLPLFNKEIVRKLAVMDGVENDEMFREIWYDIATSSFFCAINENDHISIPLLWCTSGFCMEWQQYIYENDPDFVINVLSKMTEIYSDEWRNNRSAQDALIEKITYNKWCATTFMVDWLKRLIPEHVGIIENDILVSSSTVLGEHNE